MAAGVRWRHAANRRHQRADDRHGVPYVRGLIAEDGITRFYRRYFNLEGLLGLAGVLLLVGIGLDGLIFFRWVSGSELGTSTLETAALAQSAIIISANLALGAFLAALIDIE